MAGKVVFGGGNRLLEKKAAESQGKGPPMPKPVASPDPPKEEDPGPKFKAFTGKGRSLKD